MRNYKSDKLKLNINLIIKIIENRIKHFNDAIFQIGIIDHSTFNNPNDEISYSHQLVQSYHNEITKLSNERIVLKSQLINLSLIGRI